VPGLRLTAHFSLDARFEESAQRPGQQRRQQQQIAR
jgi:hypothetical protein